MSNKPTPGSVLDQIIQKALTTLPDQPLLIAVINWLGPNMPAMEMLIKSMDDLIISPLPAAPPFWSPAKATDVLKLHRWPDLPASMAGLVDPNTELWVAPTVLVVASGHTWIFTRVGAVYGWVAREYVSISERSG